MFRLRYRLAGFSKMAPLYSEFRVPQFGFIDRPTVIACDGVRRLGARANAL
jgi:hypothetical protein